jgi:putative inorganic carbon (HCO3(-)) transporter
MNFAFLCFLAYIFMLPLEYYQEKLPKGPTGINYRTLTLIVLTAGWLLYRARRGKVPFLKSPLNPIVFSYLFIILFGVFLASFSYPQIAPVWDPGGPTFKWFLGLLNGIIIFWASAAMIDSHKRMRWALLAMLASAPIVFRAFYNDFASVRGWHFQNDMRAASPFVSVGSNELGAFLVAGAMVMFVYIFVRQRWWERLGFIVGFSWYTYCIMYSYSRGTQLAFGAALAFLAVLRHRWLLVIMVGAVATMNAWVPVSVRERWEKTTTETGELESSAESRKEYWALAMDLYTSSPLFGHGVGTFKIINPAGMDTHNLYMRTLAEQGTIGIVVLCLIWFHILRMCFAVWRGAPDSNDRQLALGVAAATLALMICNFFGDRFTYIMLIGQYWMLAGIVARLYARQMGWEPLAEPGEGSELAVDGDAPAAPRPAPKSAPDLVLPGRRPSADPAPAPALTTLSAPKLAPVLAGASALQPTPVGTLAAAPRVIGRSETPALQTLRPVETPALQISGQRPSSELKISGIAPSSALRMVNPKPETP